MPVINRSGRSVAPLGPVLNAPKSGSFPLRVQPQDKPDARFNFNDIHFFQYPSDLPKYYMKIQISNYIRNSPLKVSMMNLTDTVILPIPQLMVDDNVVAYREEAIGDVLGTTLETARHKDSWQAAKDIGQAVDASVTGDLGPAGVARQAMEGWAPNPFLTVILTGPTYKKYQFTWTVSARNAKESINLRNMMAMFKDKMSVIKRSSGAFFGYPSLFECNFVPRTNGPVDPPWLYGFKPAFLTDFRVNYTPNGMGAFYAGTGAPESLSFSISLCEVEYWFGGEGMFGDYTNGV